MKNELRQVAHPCPECGSYYRRGDKCNVCGREIVEQDDLKHLTKGK